ncbi:MAG TPA: herpeto-tandem family RiPP [Herpetosiphonaceae bacterium]
MNTKSSPREPADVSPIFGLRYLEEEEAEINGIAGCFIVATDPVADGDDDNTYYITNCDYQDIDPA